MDNRGDRDKVWYNQSSWTGNQPKKKKKEAKWKLTNKDKELLKSFNVKPE